MQGHKFLDSARNDNDFLESTMLASSTKKDETLGCGQLERAVSLLHTADYLARDKVARTAENRRPNGRRFHSLAG